MAAGASIVSGSSLLSDRSDATAATAHGTAATAHGTAATAHGTAAVATLADERILIEFDAQMRSRIWRVAAQQGVKTAVTPWTAADSLICSGSRVDRFSLHGHASGSIDGPFGRGTRLKMVGIAESTVEKSVEVDLFDRYPGFAIFRLSYRNVAPAPMGVSRWTCAAYHLSKTPVPAGGSDSSQPPFWSYCGSTHSDRRDWVRAVSPGFSQENFMGMEASDYGGGTPIVDVWRKDCGLAIGHLELIPQIVSLPVNCTDSGVDLAMTCPLKRILQPGETLVVPETFVAIHHGDYFRVLDAYRRIMGARGVASPPAPASAYEAIWCAWGYERECTLQLIEDTLPKVRELGLRWAVIDDGWQSNVGDWALNSVKYPRGTADLQRLVSAIRAQDLKPRLWYAPLAAAPGSDLLHDHTDMLLLDKEGAPQAVSWWNSFYLCPAYDKTVAHTLDLVRKFFGEWGFAGLKIDGQHLNGVAPCFNPLHRHARPEESVEKLQDFLLAIYQTAVRINPDAVVELCPCGTTYSFFNFRAFNQAPASDPESSWQVRLKGKTMKALMGPSAAFAGDHVELSDGGADFASTVGVGGIVSTKFTWPRDPKPKDSFLLTADREALWRHWIALYNERQLAQGTYRGELYDIGFDQPETHVVEKSGRFYYAFYAPDFAGSVPLRGLAPGRYRLRDYVNDRDYGEIAAADAGLKITFRGSLLIEAIPV
jgi:alpha-galactosidase